MDIDGYQTYHGYHVITYANAKSLLSTLKLTYISTIYVNIYMLYIYENDMYVYINCISNLKKKQLLNQQKTFY